MYNDRGLTGNGWGSMTVLSVLFHLGVMLLILFVPESMPGGMPGRNINGIVYEVDLVEMPSLGSQGKSGGVAAVATDDGSAKTIVQEPAQTKRIAVEKVEEKPLVIAKRTIERKDLMVKKPDLSPGQLIDKAISKIEEKVQAGGSSHLDKAISNIEKGTGGSSGSARPGGGGGGAASGIMTRIYQMEIENRIKSNWSYPVAAGNRRDLEALVILRVKSDGTIVDSRFKKTSSDSVFDQSVMKAIERSDPLPPFPEGYRRSYDEIEINFNLKDLEK
ncbi:MAG: TonB C-terminal domain-containing protein [Deltaproteobacteria bacterium]|nr:TonB C-terminal domain-containing protein [Deltaproteobacteria bacterium]